MSNEKNEICSECGDKFGFHYGGDTGKLMEEKNLCFSCAFWFELIENRRHSKSVVIDGNHFQIGCENNLPNSWKGHGGRKFCIQFLSDNRIVETTNLWHQGEIPERFRKSLPDNAIRLPEETISVLKKSTHVDARGGM